VMVGTGDPLGSGFITSLARPGGNITGLTNQTGDIGGKAFQILTELRPGLSRIAILWNPHDPGSKSGAEKQFASGPQYGDQRPIDPYQAARGPRRRFDR